MVLIRELKKRRIDVVEDEGQASNTDNICQPAEANVRGITYKLVLRINC